MEELHSALEVSDGSANSATLRKLLVLIESKRLSTMTEFNSIVSELGVESTSTVAYLRVYFVLNAMDDPGKALELLKAPALTNVEGTALPQERLDIALLSAKCAMGARRRDRALNELLAAVKMNAYFPDTFILLGENLLAMGTQLEKAKQCAERALLLKPSSERAARVLLSASEKLVSPQP
jgi:tetratricopeptide (TPR) repeat protein